MNNILIQMIAFFPWLAFVLLERPGRYASTAQRIAFFLSAMALFFLARFCAGYMIEVAA